MCQLVMGSKRLLALLWLGICVVVAAAVSPAFAGDLTTFTYGGTAPWFSQNVITHDGVNAQQSGAITNSQSSWQETTVTGPGAIRFWWKVSSESCCDPLQFSIDGSYQTDIRGEIGWQARAYAIPAGSHALRWTYSTDSSVLTGSNAGWVDQVTFEQGSNIDVTPPVTSVSPAGGTVSTTQTVTLSANEPANIYYTTNGSEPSTSSTKYTSPLAISSSTTLKFFAVDTAGNYELTKTVTYTFDTTPPTTSASLSPGTYSGRRDVSLSCSDSGMGCVATYYCLGSSCIPATLYSSAIAITTSTDLRYYSVDRGGNNEATKTNTYTIASDISAPTTTPTYASGSYRPITVNLTCYDSAGSGCANTYYCLGTGCTPTTQYNGSISIATSTVLRFYSLDRSGNNEAVNTVPYTIDANPPTTTSSVVGGIYQSPQNVTISCSDGTGSGCSTTYYCLGKGCSPSTQYTGPISIASSTYLSYYSRDIVYNQEPTKTERYTILTAPPTTINVPADRATIQTAIDAANDGDTVLVAPGTYVENINFKGKAITVISSGGPNTTIIDGNQSGSVATFNTGEERTTVLNGFTIRNGNAGWASPNYGDGGGIYISASPTISNSMITGNTASWGAGINVSSGSPLIQGNIITHNTGSSYGGGISIGGAAAAQIINNTISDNTSPDGGGISLWSAGTPTVRGNTIKNNTASGSGGGISMVNWSDATIIQNVLANNAASTGSAVYWLTPSGYRGPYLVNNTIVDTNSSQGSVVYADGYDAGALLANNIVSATGSRIAIYCGNFNDINPPQFSHNTVTPTGISYGGLCTDQNGINGNITADPQLSGPAFGYYGLRPGSPAIDAGNNSAPSLPATDFGGMARIGDGNNDGTAVVDIGVYEFDPTRPVATFQGIPTDTLTTNTLDITVGGTGVVSYRYDLDGGAFTDADIPVATSIHLTGLANGQHSIVVLGKNALGREQLLSSATVATWVVDTETTNLTFTYGGTAPWFVQPLVSHDGIAYQSGAISNNQSSWMETTVTGPGAIRFWWKVSSYGYSNPLTFSIDGNNQASISYEVDWQNKAFVIPAGSHTLRWTYAVGAYTTVSPNAGWVDQITYEQGSNLDITPPVTGATPAAGMYASSQRVTLACSDAGGGGCAGTFYCLGSDCNPTIWYNGPVSIASATDLRFYSTDAAGNSEIIKTATYSFDTTPPTTSASLSPGTYSGRRDVSLYCSDSGMGCASTYYCLGSSCTPTMPYNLAIAITASTDLRYYSVDRGGNNEAVKTSAYTITPDVTSPTTTPSYSNGTYSPISVYLSCSDGAGSGCAGTYYCLGTGCTPTTPFSCSISLAASTDLRFYSVDRAGNSEGIKAASYIIDGTPPVTTPSVGGGIYGAPQNATLSCSDGSGSGCSTTYYCLGIGCYPNTPYTGPISVSSSMYLRYYSRDMVSNQEAVKTERYTITSAAPSTINVPADRATIQAAINAAKDGDTVLVAPGIYTENIDFKGKAIAVTSSAGPSATIIDGNHAGPVVRFSTSEWRTSMLEGMTLRNGRSEFNNLGNGYGGGIAINNSSPTIRNNSIINNFGCTGAGVSVQSGSPRIQGNLIANNQQVGCTTGEGGGGIYLSGASGTELIENTISGNHVPGGNGGGIFSNGSGKFMIRGNTISNNATNGQGGGIAMINTTEPDIVQNVVAGNHAGSGGGIYWSIPYSGGINLLNNTIAGNDATQGSGVYAGGFDSNSQLINNIISGKLGQAAIYCEGGYDSSPPQIKNNVVYTPGGMAYSGICTDQNGINGNITADPQLSGPVYGYYGLRPGSPAIDAGDNSAPALPATDLNGAPRLVDGSGLGLARVDIGAYEYDPTEPRAVLTGQPAGASRETAASITVGGVGIVSYRYALDGGPFTTADTPVATPIVLSDLAGGAHAVAVIGKTLTREQLVSSATVATWTIDTIPPVTTAAPAGGTYTAPQAVTLSCDDNSGSGCAGTFYCLGGDCTPTTPYTGPIVVNAPTGLRFYSLDAFGYQETIKTASYTFVGTLSGRVTDSVTGNGVQGVGVTVYNAVTGASTGYGYTDSSGSYNITGLTSGTHKLLFTAAGYIEQWYSGKTDRSAANTVAVSAPSATTGIDVIMVMGGSITGIVTGKDTGAGIQNVSVVAYHANTGAWGGYGYTDSSGAYTISGLAPGDYKLSFDSQSSSGYLAQWYSNTTDLASATPVTVTGPGTIPGINAALLRGGSITGRVTDSVNGAAIANAYVTAVDATTGTWINSGNTDSSGVYTITGLAGTYKLMFTGTGYVEQWYSGKANQTAATIVTVTAPNTTSGINMTMVKGGSITGIVTDSSTGKGIQDAYVYAYNTSTGSWIYSYYTDSSGAYVITGLPTGTYKLRFSADGYVERWSGAAADMTSAAIVVVTAPNSTGGMNMGLVKGAVITGTVVGKDTGLGVQNVNVAAYNAVTGSWGGSGYTGSNGAYTISGLASGSYKLQFFSNSTTSYLGQWYSNKDQQSTATAVDVIAPNTVGGIDVTLERGGSITGTVIDKDTGDAIQNVSINAYNAATNQWISSGYTDSTGAYSVVGLATGSYKISFSATGYVTQSFDGRSSQSATTTVSVTAPNTTANINASLAKAGSLSGTITDRATGVGIAGSYLYAIDYSTGDWAGSAQTDGNGKYSITGLPSGSYRLKIDPSFGDGYIGRWYGGQDSYLCAESITVTAPNGTTGIDAQLDQGGSISGRVTDVVTGLGISGVSISLTNTATQARTVTSNIAIDSTGAYIIGGLPGGEYSLVFSAPDYVRSTSPVVVRVSAPEVITGVDASLVRGGGISGRITDGTGGGIDEVLVEAVDIQTRYPIGSSLTDYNGNYTITGLPSGSYALYYDGRSAGVAYGSGWKTLQSVGVTTTTASRASTAIATSVAPPPHGYPPPSYPPPGYLGVPLFMGQSLPVDTPPSAQSFSVVAPGVTTGIDMMLDRTGAISGRVTDSATDGPLDWILVSAYDSISGAVVGSAITTVDGSYTINGVPSGSYRIRFTSTASSNGGYVGTWYGSGTDTVTGAEAVVQAPETTSGVDVRLAKGGGITGRVSVNSCPGPRVVNIRAYDSASGTFAGQTSILTTYTDSFTIGGLPAGSYKLAINPVGAGFVRQWYLNQRDMISADLVTVSAGTITSINDVPLAVGGGSISGKVTGNPGCMSLPASIRLYDGDSGGLVAEGRTSPDGSYQFSGLPDASYKLLFTMNQLDLWYRTSDETAQASPVVVSGGLSVTGIDLTGACPPGGLCGRDNGQVLAQTVPVALCANGTPSPVTGSGHPWSWTCQGDIGTDPVSCSATIQSYTLLLSVPAASGRGNIHADVVSNDEPPVALFCPASFCSAQYDYGSTVRLTALPDSISLFAAWGGACSADPCAVSMTSPKAVSALFARAFSFKNISIGMFDNSLAILVSASNAGNEIRMLAAEMAIENLTLDKRVTLSGGWKGFYQAQDTNPTTLNGTITVKDADSTINDTAVKGGLFIHSGSLRVNRVQVSQ